MKCPYCRGSNLYLKRTSPMLQYGCRTCEKEIAILRQHGISEKEIRSIFNSRKRTIAV